MVTMKEIVDIVDDNDNVIGQKTRKECHDEMIRHRSVVAMIFKDSSYSELLIQKRGRTEEINPLKWCLVGGHMISGETYLEGLKRELNEEMFVGVDFPSLEFTELFKIKVNANDDHEFITIFRTVYDGNFTTNPEEAEDYQYVDIEKLLDDLENNPEKYTETIRTILKKYREMFL